MQNEIALLKKQVRQLQVVILFFISLIMIFTASAFTKKKAVNEILRTKGIVIVDEQGRDRILLEPPYLIRNIG
jgi:hypothetical protein